MFKKSSLTALNTNLCCISLKSRQLYALLQLDPPDGRQVFHVNSSFLYIETWLTALKSMFYINIKYTDKFLEKETKNIFEMLWVGLRIQKLNTLNTSIILN